MKSIKEKDHKEGKEKDHKEFKEKDRKEFKEKDHKEGKEKDKGWACDLIPKALIVARYFAAEQMTVDELSAGVEAAGARMADLEEEHGGEEQHTADARSDLEADVGQRRGPGGVRGHLQGCPGPGPL